MTAWIVADDGGPEANVPYPYSVSHVGAHQYAEDLRTLLSERDSYRKALETAREAFLDLIADAQEWDEQTDEDDEQYLLRFAGRTILPLLTALGIELWLKDVRDPEGFTYGIRETPADAIERVIEETPARQALSTQEARHPQPKLSQRQAGGGDGCAGLCYYGCPLCGTP